MTLLSIDGLDVGVYMLAAMVLLIHRQFSLPPHPPPFQVSGQGQEGRPTSAQTCVQRDAQRCSLGHVISTIFDT